MCTALSGFRRNEPIPFRQIRSRQGTAYACLRPDGAVLDERRKAAEARPLFTGTEPLAVTIAADFRAVQYRGPCKTAAELEPFFARFRAARPDITALYSALPDMTPSYRKDALKYLDGFYRTIHRRGAATAAFIDRCDNRQGM